MKFIILKFLLILLLLSCKDNFSQKTYSTREELGKAYVEFINKGSKWEDYKSLIADKSLLKNYFEKLVRNRMKVGFLRKKYPSKINPNTTMEFIDSFVKEHQDEFDDFISELLKKNKINMERILNQSYGLDKTINYIDKLKQNWKNRLINIKELPLEFISIKGKPEKKMPDCDENLWLIAKTSGGNEIKFFFNYICKYGENGYKIFVDKPYFMPIIDNNEGWEKYRRLKKNH